jgi:hypothetical protein
MEERKSFLLSLIQRLEEKSIRINGVSAEEEDQERQALLEDLHARLLLWDLLESEKGKDWDFIFNVNFPLRLSED